MASIAIEFFGMPGSGKSYVAGHLAAQLRQQGFRVSERTLSLSRANAPRRILGKVGLVARGFVSGVRLLPVLLALVADCGAGGLKRKTKLVFNWLYLCALVRIDSRDHQVLVLDQGFAQALWSTFFYAAETSPAAADFMQRLLERLPIDYLSVVHVDTDAQCIKRRLAGRSRGNSPLDRDLSGAWQRANRVTGETRTELLRVAALVSNFELLDLDNTDDGVNAPELERVAREMSGMRLLRQAGGAGLG